MIISTEVAQFPGGKTAFILVTCAQDNMGEAYMENLPKVADAVGTLQASPPYGRYHEWRETDCDIEMGCGISGPLEGDHSEVKQGDIPSFEGIKSVFKGHYDGLKEGYGNTFAWMGENGWEMNGAPMEVYITDPGEVPNPDDWLTEIWIPAQKN
jgi:effector-binding domain-containing protein